MKLNYLIGSENIYSYPLPVFSEVITDMLEKLSGLILKDKEARFYPDVISVGYWCRKSNIERKKQSQNVNYRIGRGLAFHITPSNIPVNFFFSYLFSLLAGNANIVRVPSKDFPQIKILVRILKECIKDFPEIEKRTAFVRYDRNDEITEKFSQISDVRVIWGGDKTVSKIKSMVSKPRCIDIAFSDRFSVGILNSKKITELNEKELKTLVQNFYNDTYLMDQNACSSPRLICWIGDKDEGKKKFWDELYNLVSLKYKIFGAVCVDKYTRLCRDIMDRDDIINKRIYGNLLNVIELKNIPSNTKTCEGFGGYFYETDIKSFEDICPICDLRLQTIVYYGIDSVKLSDILINNNVLGADRIVPIGSSMDIDIIWDGYDLISAMSRKINVI